jgi:hypothetical protein
MTTPITPIYWRFVLLDRAATIIDANGMPLNISKGIKSIKYTQSFPSLPLLPLTLMTPVEYTYYLPCGRDPLRLFYRRTDLLLLVRLSYILAP